MAVRKENSVELDFTNKDILGYGSMMKSAYLASIAGVLTCGIGSVYASYFCELMSDNVGTKKTRNSKKISALMTSMSLANIKLAKMSLMAMVILLIETYFHGKISQSFIYLTAITWGGFVAVSTVGLLMIYRRWCSVIDTAKNAINK